MKKLILLLAITIAMFSCNASSDEEVKKDIDKTVELKTEGFEKDMELFKKTMAENIAANERNIEAFKEKINNQKKETKAEYEKNITDLEAKNAEMKKRIAEFNAENESSWVSFKEEFGSDMDQLGKAFKDFTINNK